MPAKKKKKSKAPDLELKCENGWKTVSAAERKKILGFAEEYKEFLSTAKTERACHDLGISLARDKGYQDLAPQIKSGKQLKAGDKVYLSVGGKTLILARIGKKPITDGLQIIGGHTDSPRIDLKPRPLYENDGICLLDTHYYGGIKKYQWVALPLALHGVIVKNDGTVVPVSVGEDPADPVFTITDLLPHLGKDQAGKKLSDAFPGDNLDVLFGSMPLKGEDSNAVKKNLLKLLNDNYGVDEADLASAELELVPAGPARDLGLDQSMILAYGQDDRVCSYAGIRALLDQKGTPPHTSICIMCDKEEIGSTGSTGMESYVFENAIAEIVNLCSKDYSDLLLRRTLQASSMISADVNALHDPMFPEVSSPHGNMAKMNHGVVVSKYTGSRGKSRTNDASAEYVARIRKIFDDAKVLWQMGELGKVDQGGGGTIAYMLARYEMDVIDCGVGLLSMHAPFEVAGKLDIYMAYKAYAAFYQA